MEGLFVYTRNREAMECPEIVKAEKHYGYAMKIGMIGLNIHTIAEPQATAVFFETDALGKSIVANLAARSGRHKGGSLVGYMDSHAKFVRLGDPVK